LETNEAIIQQLIFYLSPLVYGEPKAAGATLLLYVAAKIAIGSRYGNISRN